jgi:hypothetical protein
VLIAAAAGYLAFMKVSHSTPFSSTLQVELAVGGWLILASQIITWFVTQPPGSRRRALDGRWSPRPGRGRLRGRWDLAVTGVLFAFLIGTAAAVGATGNVSDGCTSAATCFKIDNWHVADSRYYRQYPYDAAGNSDPSAPWIRVSRVEYVAEVGSLLRMAAFFGLFTLVPGMLANLSAEWFASDPRRELDW